MWLANKADHSNIVFLVALALAFLQPSVEPVSISDELQVRVPDLNMNANLACKLSRRQICLHVIDDLFPFSESDRSLSEDGINESRRVI